jgi:TPR repeat protein
MFSSSIGSGATSPTTPPITPHQKRVHSPDPVTDTKIQAVAQNFWDTFEALQSRLNVLRLVGKVHRSKPPFIKEVETIITSLNSLLIDSNKSLIFNTLGEIYSCSSFGKENYPRAIAYYEKAADLGCLQSLLILANFYLDPTFSEGNITFIPKSQGKALEYINKAIDHCTDFYAPQDLYSIAQLLFKINPTEKIVNHIIKLLDKVIEHPSTSKETRNTSKQHLAEIYLGVPLPIFFNIDKVLKTLERLDAPYSNHLWGEVGEYYYQKKCYSKAIAAFNKEPNQGHFAYTLFKMYHHGLGVDKNLKKAFTYLFENVAEHYSEAELHELSLYKKKSIMWLGLCYADGLGTEENLNQGEKYLSYVEGMFSMASDRLEDIRRTKKALFESQVADFKATIETL